MLVRPGSDPTALVAAGCEPRLGDLRDRRSLDAACAGVDTVVTTAISVGRVAPDTVETVELAGYERLIGAARAAGVRRFVYTSAFGADARSPIPFIAAKAVTEERVRSSGMNWTVLAPDSFMDVWLGIVVAVRRSKVARSSMWAAATASIRSSTAPT